VFELWGQKVNPWPVSSTGSHQARFQNLGRTESAGPLDLLRVQGFEMIRNGCQAVANVVVRASGNAPELGTHLVRFRL